jgi:ArsR family transcriptional regulator
MTRSPQPARSTSTSKTARLTRSQRTAILRALADPKRFELLERIARASCPLACTEAREGLSISPATLSHHIKELESAGLITIACEGKFHFLSIKPGVLESLATTLESLTPVACQLR